MANGVELATGYVTLTVETKKLGSQIGRSFAGADTLAGQTGRRMGQAMTQSFQKSQPNLDALADKVKQVEQKIANHADRSARQQANSKAKVDIAQAKLNETYEKTYQKISKENEALAASGRARRLSTNEIDAQVRSSSQYLVASDRLSVSQQRLEAETISSADAQSKLKTELREAKTELARAGDASSKAAAGYAKGWRGIGQRLKTTLTGGVRKASDSAKREADKGGKRAGGGFATAFKRFAAPLAGALSVGAVFGKGWNRLTAIENAQAKLKGLGHDTQTVTTIMANANEAVSGTAYGLDEAATTAAGAVAAGIKPGRELEGVLKSVANASAASGAEMAEMGAIYNKVATSGKAQNDILNQVADRGIPIYQALADVMGVTADEVFNLAKKGEVDFQTFEKAMTKAAGTVADEMGNTVTGASKNFFAAVGRIGAGLLSGVFGEAGTTIKGITKAMKPLEAKAAETGKKIGDALTLVMKGIKGVSDILFKGEFGTELREAFGWEEDHPLVGFLFTTRDLLGEVFKWVQDNSQWLGALKGAIMGVTVVWGLWTIAMKIWSGATTVAAMAMKAFNKVMEMNPALRLIIIIGAVVGALVWLYRNNETARKIMQAAWEGIKKAVEVAWSGIKVAIQWIVDGFKWLGGIAAEVWGHIQGAVQVGVEGVKVAAGAVVSFFRDKVAPVFVWLYESVVKPIWKVIATAIAIAVTPIVAAVMFMVWVFKNLVAPVFVWLYESVVKPAFNGIKIFIGFVVGLVQKYMGYWVALFRNVVAPVFVWLYNNIVKPAFNGIKTAISFAWTAIKAIFSVLVNVVRKSVGATFSWLYQYIVKPVFGAIKWVISTWWAGAKILFQQVVNFVRGPLANVFKWLYDKIIKPVWDGISRTISRVWNKGIKPVFDALGSFIRDTVAPVFQKGVDKITKIWDTLREAAKKPIKFVVDKVINGGLIKAFNIVAGWIPGVNEIGEVKIAGFDRGGWTGPGARLDPAGIVHADEFVVRKWARQRFERENPGFLNHVNKHGTMEGYASGGLVRPVRGGKMTSGFGTSRGRYPHAGLDLAVPTGTPVFASMAGRVTRAGWNAITGRSGIGAFLDHEGGRNTYYGHLSRLMVKVGDMVKKGQQIALSGNTGRSTGPHLHWETWTGGKPVNPAPYLNGAMLPVGGVGGDPGGGGNPLQAILDFGGKIAGMFTDRFPGGAHLVNIAKGTGTKLFTDVKDWLDAKLRAIGDVGRDTWGNVKDIFNGPDNEVKKAVRGVAAGYGWNSGRHWDSLNKLISKESSWDPNAQNKGSTAYGLFQFLNSTWGKYGTKTSDPAGQARAGLKYIQDRYDNPENAWRFWKKNRWYADGGLVTPYKYDSGGWLNPGFTPIVNHTRKPEAIYTASQDQDLQTLAEYARGKIEDERNDAKGGGDTYYMTVPKEAGVDELVSALKFAKRRNRRKGKNG